VRPSNAGVQRTRTDRSLLGDGMDWRGWLAAVAVRRYVLPIAIGSLVAWLIANNHPDFADALCSVAAGFAIAVENCR
jgi:hypothetical protein